MKGHSRLWDFRPKINVDFRFKCPKYHPLMSSPSMSSSINQSLRKATSNIFFSINPSLTVNVAELTSI